MLDRLSVKEPVPVPPAGCGLVPPDAHEVQSRFWQHLVRLTEPARRLGHIRKNWLARRTPYSLPLEGMV